MPGWTNDTLDPLTGSRPITGWWADFTIAVNGIASEEVVGQPQIKNAPLDVYLDGIPSEEVVGQPAITYGQDIVLDGGAASEEVVGEPSLTVGAVDIVLEGIANEEVVGQPEVTVGPISTYLDGIASEEAVGTPAVIYDQTIEVDGIPSEEVVGELVSVTPVLRVLVDGIPSEEAVGEPSLTVGPVSVVLNGVPSEEAVGRPTVVPPVAPFDPFSTTYTAGATVTIPENATWLEYEILACGGPGGKGGAGVASTAHGGGGGGGGSYVRARISVASLRTLGSTVILGLNNSAGAISYLNAGNGTRLTDVYGGKAGGNGSTSSGGSAGAGGAVPSLKTALPQAVITQLAGGDGGAVHPADRCSFGTGPR